MPRGRPRLIGPLLPTGGYKALTSKKRLASKIAAYAAMSAKMLSGANTRKPRRAYGTAKSRGRPRKTSIATIVNSNISTATQPKTKRAATEKQLAALAKARAARAAKRTGTTVAVAVATPKVSGQGRGRPKRIGPNLPPGGYKALMSLNAKNAASNMTYPVVAFDEYF